MQSSRRAPPCTLADNCAGCAWSATTTGLSGDGARTTAGGCESRYGDPIIPPVGPTIRFDVNPCGVMTIAQKTMCARFSTTAGAKAVRFKPILAFPCDHCMRLDTSHHFLDSIPVKSAGWINRCASPRTVHARHVRFAALLMLFLYCFMLFYAAVVLKMVNLIGANDHVDKGIASDALLAMDAFHCKQTGLCVVGTINWPASCLAFQSCSKPSDTAGYDLSSASENLRLSEFEVSGVRCAVGYGGRPTATACTAVLSNNSRIGEQSNWVYGEYTLSGCVRGAEALAQFAHAGTVDVAGWPATAVTAVVELCTADAVTTPVTDCTTTAATCSGTAIDASVCADKAGTGTACGGADAAAGQGCTLNLAVPYVVGDGTTASTTCPTGCTITTAAVDEVAAVACIDDPNGTYSHLRHKIHQFATILWPIL